jgi:GTP-binding protein
MQKKKWSVNYSYFETSVFNKNQLNEIKKEQINEIAFFGKSNSGKSSLLNYLCWKKKLAYKSKKPGSTKSINFFAINKKQFFFVDLPGYGFSKLSKKEIELNEYLINEYLKNNKKLKLIFFLFNVNRIPNEIDEYWWKICKKYNSCLILTKIDKVSKNKLSDKMELIRNFFKIQEEIIMNSSLKKKGKEEVEKKINLI